MKLKNPDYTEYINRGVKYLDELYPEWLDKVNVDTLNMNDCYLCVIGQLFGDYYKRPSDRFNDSTGKSSYRGFSCNMYALECDPSQPVESFHKVFVYHYSVLTIQWQVKILQLRYERKKEKEKESEPNYCGYCGADIPSPNGGHKGE